MISFSSCTALKRLSTNALLRSGGPYNRNLSSGHPNIESNRRSSDRSFSQRRRQQSHNRRGDREEDSSRRYPDDTRSSIIFRDDNQRPRPRGRVPQEEENVGIQHYYGGRGRRREETNPPQPAQGNIRTIFEEKHHLGRQLSKFQISPSQQKKWKNVVKLFPPLPKFWIPPDQVSPGPKYESDALEQIHAKSYEANVLLEVRDVRVPASSHHPSFTRLAKHRLHLICYTHADLIDATTRDRVEQWTQNSFPGSRSIFIDVRENRPIHLDGRKKTVITAEEKLDDDDEEEKGNEDGDEEEGVWDLVYDSLLQHLENKGGINAALTVGVANTGKSSLLMAMVRTARNRGDLEAKGTKARVRSKRKKGGRKNRLEKVRTAIGIQDQPGKTRELTEYLLRDNPQTFFLDVPGLTPPKFFLEERPEAWFALAATNLLPPNAINRKNPDSDQFSTICEYVLHCMNRDGNFGYIQKLRLDEPTHDIDAVLEACRSMKKEKNMEDPEEVKLSRCMAFLKLLNTGNFGPVILDDLRYTYKKFQFKDHHFTKQA